MEKPSSLQFLSKAIWTRVCHFLSDKGHKRLYELGGSPRQGCEDFYHHFYGVFLVEAVWDFNNGNKLSGGYVVGRLLDGDRLVVQTVGHLYRRVTVITRCFHMEPSTFKCMLHYFAGTSSRLESLTVLVKGPYGLDFMTCCETNLHNWSRFIHACKKRRPNVEIFLDVTITEVKSREMLRALFMCCPSDLRCEHLSRLDISELYKCHPERPLVSPELFPTPTLYLLKKFPNLKTVLVD
ncbi:hypothetical protein ACOMHN_044560 [Nucella lapillus]